MIFNFHMLSLKYKSSLTQKKTIVSINNLFRQKAKPINVSKYIEMYALCIKYCRQVKILCNIRDGHKWITRKHIFVLQFEIRMPYNRCMLMNPGSDNALQCLQLCPLITNFQFTVLLAITLTSCYAKSNTSIILWYKKKRCMWNFKNYRLLLD